MALPPPAPQGVNAVDIVEHYAFPADLDGAGARIALVEFGGTFTPSELDIASTLAGLRVPTVIDVPVGSLEADPEFNDHLQPALQRIADLVERFRSSPATPSSTARFEKDLLAATRELGRSVAGWTYNHLEPADVQALPVEVRFEGGTFRRLGKKTPQQVSTLFGPAR